MAFQIPPHEVLERFTEGEMIHLVAYEKLYGQLGPERFDTLFARLGMDTVSPHLKKGKKPKFEDHLITWGSGKTKKVMTSDEMLREAKGIQRTYSAVRKAEEAKKSRNRTPKRDQRRPEDRERRTRPRRD